HCRCASSRAGDEDRAQHLARCACMALSRQVLEIDRVEAFDQSRLLQLRSHQCAGSSLVTIQVRKSSVPLGVVICGIDHNLALEGVRGEGAELAEWNGHQDYFAKLCCLLNGRRVRL